MDNWVIQGTKESYRHVQKLIRTKIFSEMAREKIKDLRSQ